MAAEAKAKVLALVSEGMSVHKAMEQNGKKPDTVRIWCLRDPAFATALAEAKENAKERSLKAMGVAREDITFPQFSEMFLIEILLNMFLQKNVKQCRLCKR